MSRVITFSRTFPCYHPRAGEFTYFVEKFHKSMGFTNPDDERLFDPRLSLDDFDPKHHTIRAGHRWKAGDWFSPRVWSGKPYNSKQIIIAPDTQVKKTWDFHVDACGLISIAKPGEQLIYVDEEDVIAANDGLTTEDFVDWIAMPYYIKSKDSGAMQIICWNEKIEY